jgi:phosphomevalonate kinase
VKVESSAPGKLVLAGEYAVLAGAPALVLAMDRRARVSLAPAAGGSSTVECTGGAEGTASYGWRGTALTSSGAAFPLIEAILVELREELALAQAPPFAARIDTSEFSERAGTASSKLGLGSSAALTVAFASALAEYTGRPSPQAHWVGRLIAVHRRFQNGRGSGLDIAASLFGGVISYRMNGAVESPAVAPRPLPDSLRLLTIWSGRSVSTEAALERLARWRAQSPVEYARALDELKEVATAADEAARTRDSRALLDSLSAYGDSLRRFAAASGLEIYSTEHARIADVAREHGAVYKPCGAGGGDVGVACGDDAAALEALRKAITEAGFRALALAVDPIGLQVQPSLE